MTDRFMYKINAFWSSPGSEEILLLDSDNIALRDEQAVPSLPCTASVGACSGWISGAARRRRCASCVLVAPRAVHTSPGRCSLINDGAGKRYRSRSSWCAQ